MAMKKTGLGKGLDALFSTGPLEEDKEEEKVVEKVDESEKIHKIKITETARRFRPRGLSSFPGLRQSGFYS